MGTVDRGALAAQGLDASDLEANRAGRVSQRQLARQRDVRRGGAVAVWGMAAVMFVGCVGGGAVMWTQGFEPGLAIGVAILGLVMAALPLAIYHAFRFADPAKVAACPVTRLEAAEVGVLLPGSNRGVYAISLDGRRYAGFASDLSRADLGARVNAYVVEQHRIVVALEPIDG